MGFLLDLLLPAGDFFRFLFIPFLTVGELTKSNVFGLHKPKHSFLFRLTYLIYEGHY